MSWLTQGLCNRYLWCLQSLQQSLGICIRWGHNYCYLLSNSLFINCAFIWRKWLWTTYNRTVLEIAVFWNVMLCRLLQASWCLTGLCSFHLQDLPEYILSHLWDSSLYIYCCENVKSHSVGNCVGCLCEVVALLHVWEVQCTDLSLETSCSDWSYFGGFLQFCPKKARIVRQIGTWMLPSTLV